MTTVGLTRIHINEQTKGKGAWRFERSQKFWPLANAVYRNVFEQLGCPLLPGETAMETTREAHEAGYDRQLGHSVGMWQLGILQWPWAQKGSTECGKLTSRHIPPGAQ